MKLKLSIIAAIAGLIALTTSVVLAAPPPLSLVGYDPISGWGMTAAGDWRYLMPMMSTPTPSPTPTAEPTATPAPLARITLDEPMQLTATILAIRGQLKGIPTGQIRGVTIHDEQGNLLAAIRSPYNGSYNNQDNIVVATDWAIAGDYFYIRGAWLKAISSQSPLVWVWGARLSGVIDVGNPLIPLAVINADGDVIPTPEPPAGDVAGILSGAYASHTSSPPPTPGHPTPTPAYCFWHYVFGVTCW